MDRSGVALAYVAWLIGAGVLLVAAKQWRGAARKLGATVATVMLAFGTTFVIAFPAPLIGGDGTISLGTLPLALLGSPFIFAGFIAFARAYLRAP